MIFRINNKILIMEKEEHEVDEFYYFRCTFIIKQNIKSVEEFEKYLNLSFYVANHYFYGCIYENNIMNIIKDYLRINKLDI